MATTDSSGPVISGKILIVDERPQNLALLSRALNKRGYTVTASSGVEEAISAFNAEPPDLVIIERITPESEIANLLSWIRKDSEGQQRVPVILVSVHDEIDRKLSAFSAGVDDFVSKPYHIQEFLARVAAQLRIRQLETQLLDSQKLKAIYEMAGAACHELSQPLTAIVGYTQMLLRSKKPSDPDYGMLEQLMHSSQNATDVLAKIQRINTYVIKDYAGALKIIDLELAAKPVD